jgi:hypothetical protein
MAQPSDAHPVELHLFSPRSTDSIVELLFAVAHYRRTAARLGVGDSINFGRPWVEDSSCEYGLISLPYLDGPKLEKLTIGVSEIRCLWLIPVTAAEAQFKQRHGLEALEQEFELAGFDYLNPKRRSVV